jgi:hypothetical protein
MADFFIVLSCKRWKRNMGERMEGDKGIKGIKEKKKGGK